MQNDPSLPLAVVVTPVYNGETYLRETMESVQAQTYGNTLHLVINNASTDGTADILADFTDGRVPVKVIKHDELLPQIDNWNSAIDAVPENAAWVRLLCADDLMLPQALEKTVALGESDPKIGLVCSVRDLNGKIDPGLWPEDETVFDGGHALRRFFENCGKVIAPHMLVRREALTVRTPFFNDTTLAGFDTDAALCVLTEWKYGFCHEHLAHTRVHEDTVTSQSIAPKRLELLVWYILLDRYADHAFPAGEAVAMKRRYRRHYLRRLANARRTGDASVMWDAHMQGLAKIDASPTRLSFVDAAIDKLLIRLGLRPDWFAYPW